LVIERVRLVRYKGFENFTLRIGRPAILVGPNNSGKTTLVQSLRLTAALLRHARLNRVGRSFDDAVLDNQHLLVQGHLMSGVGSRQLTWYKDENLRHEFREEPTGLEVQFKSGARLRAVWPVDDPAFFYVEKEPGVIAGLPAEVRRCAPTLGVVPTLVPVEHRELVLSASHVRESIGTRLTSRHFRNQLSICSRTIPLGLTISSPLRCTTRRKSPGSRSSSRSAPMDRNLICTFLKGRLVRRKRCTGRATGYRFGCRCCFIRGSTETPTHSYLMNRTSFCTRTCSAGLRPLSMMLRLRS
jgi:hypothetical protein